VSSHHDPWDFSFHVAGSSAAVWLLRAYRLRRAADIMWRQATRDVNRLVAQGPDLKVPWGPEATGQAAMLLSGLTIEVLIKALLVRRDGPRVQAGVLKPWGKKPKHDHDIVKLFGLAGEHLTAEERTFAERLTKFIRWAGRYPLPKNVEEMRPKRITTGPHRGAFDGATLPGAYSPADRLRFRRLFGRLEKTLADEGVKWTAG
jgi:hypothetical protein